MSRLNNRVSVCCGLFTLNPDPNLSKVPKTKPTLTLWKPLAQRALSKEYLFVTYIEHFKGDGQIDKGLCNCQSTPSTKYLTKCFAFYYPS